MERFEIEGVSVAVFKLRPDGHAAEGWIFADPGTPDIATATYVYVPDRYDVTPHPAHPSADKHRLGGTGYDLAAAVRITKGWVAESKQPESVR